MSTSSALLSPSLNPSQPAVQPPVKIRVDVPQPVFDKFKAAADALGRDVEEYIGEHLKQTVNQDHSSAGLWFNADLSQRLCKLTGRGTCHDPETVLNRLSPLAEIKIHDSTEKPCPDCATETDGRKRRWCKQCGGVGTIHRMEDLVVSLDAQVMDRLKHIRRGITPAQFITREATNGIRVSLGLGAK